MQTNQVQDVDTAWAKVVSRAAHVLLARQDVSYARLATKLSGIGITESARSVQGKVQRGTFKFTFFLQALVAAGTDCPYTWVQALRQESSWDARATAVLSAELALRPSIDWPTLSRRLEHIGVPIAPASLRAQAEDGSFASALFFQCAAVCHFDDIQLYLDSSMLNEAVKVGRVTSQSYDVK
ncbi:DUF6471 domain-containing protein [Paraburkholderia sp. LEh10]|uniref:DUF6471 domain-containing protein n=1 Tax=Paraburkholderia sp. LEh10 TaxID=2821353 RepID=UPI001FD85CC4|nr:DUF6471 domain-containing protein [Paraburkholderia sp. LEh10]